jgi:hypothetical protein
MHWYGSLMEWKMLILEENDKKLYEDEDEL